MRQRKHQSLDGLLALLLFGVFAACVLSVLLTGADAYRGLTGRDQASYDQRTAAQYLTTRVRQADTAGGVFVAAFDGTDGSDTLFLAEQIDGRPYYTRVYCYDGYMRELFSSAEAGLNPEDGEKVMEISSLEFSREGELLIAELTGTDGDTERVALFTRSSGEAAS